MLRCKSITEIRIRIMKIIFTTIFLFLFIFTKFFRDPYFLNNTTRLFFHNWFECILKRLFLNLFFFLLTKIIRRSLFKIATRFNIWVWIRLILFSSLPQQPPNSLFFNFINRSKINNSWFCSSNYSFRIGIIAHHFIMGLNPSFLWFPIYFFHNGYKNNH